jgi:hypothetical protein
MNFGTPPYFSGIKPLPQLVLDRFLPPYPYGGLTDMIHHQGIDNGWVLDPIGNHPASAIELAQAGYRVFVACNNPILAKLFEVICAAYPSSEYQAAIADLGALKRGEQRIESQIKGIYRSPCPECSSFATNIRFLWKRNQQLPFARELTCKDCENTGVFKLSDIDLKNLEKIGNIQLHRTKVLQRVIPGKIDPPVAIKEVVDSYLPRSLAVISTLINKLDSLYTSPIRKSIIEALLIHVFDYGNMLWGISTGRSRPKQISIPAEFYEFNLWNIIEEADSRLRLTETPITFTYYPEFPPDNGGICFYPGRMQSIKDFTQLPEFSVVATVLPRPNQAMWTYNAVWSGWIWGQEAALKLKGALERRRYDWIWHTQAIRTIFEYTSKFNIPFLASAPELTNSYILAYLAAASSSGYQLVDAAYHFEQKSGQFYWLPKNTAKKVEPNLQINDNIKNYLALKSEPADYQELMSVFMISETKDQRDSFSMKKFDNSLFIQIQKLFEETITNKEIFTQVDDDQLENAEFWLTQTTISYQPYSDQIEGIFIRFIQKNPEFSLEEVASFINQHQPGLLPVTYNLLQRLLNSYCEPNSNDTLKWIISSHETIQERKSDIHQIKSLLNSIGKNLGFIISGENPIQWISDHLTPNYQFFITASSIISQFKRKIDETRFEPVIIFPGSRSELISYKLRNDPIYNKFFGKYHFVKFRHLRSISENPGMNFKTWVHILDSDPAVWQEANQPVLF